MLYYKKKTDQKQDIFDFCIFIFLRFGEATHYEHQHQKALQIQTFRSIRVLDYLLSLDYIDKSRVAVTGASGGATQTFFLTVTTGQKIRRKWNFPILKTFINYME